MPITSDGWIDWARRDPGPADKRYTEPCTSEGVVLHSAVGSYAGWRSRLDDLTRLPNGRYTEYAAASVTGWIAYDGTLIQHYQIDVSCWASGNRIANTTRNAFEEEGGYQPVDERLREPQIVTSVRVIEEIATLKGWTPARPLAGQAATLLEHNECVALWGGESTGCPHSRIPWAEILRRITGQEDEVSKQLMYVAGAFQFLASDVYQGFEPNAQVCNEVLGLIGDGPVTPVTSRQHAYGLLTYAASEALRGNAINATATAMVRFLCKTRPKLA